MIIASPEITTKGGGLNAAPKTANDPSLLGDAGHFPNLLDAIALRLSAAPADQAKPLDLPQPQLGAGETPLFADQEAGNLLPPGGIPLPPDTSDRAPSLERGIADPQRAVDIQLATADQFALGDQFAIGGQFAPTGQFAPGGNFHSEPAPLLDLQRPVPPTTLTAALPVAEPAISLNAPIDEVLGALPATLPSAALAKLPADAPEKANAQQPQKSEPALLDNPDVSNPRVKPRQLPDLAQKQEPIAKTIPLPVAPEVKPAERPAPQQFPPRIPERHTALRELNLRAPAKAEAPSLPERPNASARPASLDAAAKLAAAAKPERPPTLGALAQNEVVEAQEAPETLERPVRALSADRTPAAERPTSADLALAANRPITADRHTLADRTPKPAEIPEDLKVRAASAQAAQISQSAQAPQPAQAPLASELGNEFIVHRAPISTEPVASKQNSEPIQNDKLGKLDINPAQKAARSEPVQERITLTELPQQSLAVMRAAKPITAVAKDLLRVEAVKKPSTASSLADWGMPRAAQTTLPDPVRPDASENRPKPSALPERALETAAPKPVPTAVSAQPSVQPVSESTSQPQIGALQPSHSVTSAPVTSDVRADARPMAQLGNVIDQLAEARETGRAAKPELTVRHQEFGAINLRLDATGSDLRASLSARDPGFVPAVQAALADRAIAASSETSSGQSQRGNDQNSGNQPGTGSQTGSQSDRHYGSSTGSQDASSQPYSEQSGSSDEETGARSSAAEADQDDRGQSDSGLFA